MVWIKPSSIPLTMYRQTFSVPLYVEILRQPLVMGILTFTKEKIDTAALNRSMATPGAGAVVHFEGHVRDTNQNRHVTRLEYEAADKIEEKEFAKIVDEVHAQYAIIGLTCVHRVGTLNVGEIAVWIGVTAPHRAAAFEACRYVIDELKKRVPIWKKEHYTDGDSGWINTGT